MLEGWVRHSVGRFFLDTHWRVEDGRVLAIVGPSGAGKTMTLRAITGLVRPDAGYLALGGRVLHCSERGVWVKPHERGVGYVPQQYALFPHLSVRRNVTFGARGKTREERERAAARAMETFRIADVADRSPGKLSGGQQQRVALARALAPEPQALLLDEPFAALDVPLRRELRREVLGIKERVGVPIVLVTHDLADAVAMADVVIVLEDGRVVDEGRPLDVIERPRARGLSRVTEIQNVFEGLVASVSPEDGIMTCDLGPVSIVTAHAGLRPGETARVGVRAGDVLVAVEPPAGLSAQNVIPGVIDDVAKDGFERLLSVDCGGVTFRAEVTPRSAAQLDLRAGRKVWLVIKSNACFLLD